MNILYLPGCIGFYECIPIFTIIQRCITDAECPVGEYCYEISKSCVTFTKCEDFNREETPISARDVSQCGPCFSGFSAENSTDTFCRRIPNLITDPESSLNVALVWQIVIPISVAIIVLFIIFVVYYIHIKKRHIHSIVPLNERYSDNLNEQKVVSDQEKVFKPTAPPEGIYVGNQVDKNERNCQPFNSNGEELVNDNSQKATAWFPPDWVSNANLPNESNNNNNNAEHPVRRNRVSRACYVPAARNNPDTDRELTALMPAQTTEHEDNARNTALVKTNSSSDDNDTDSIDCSTTQCDDENQDRNGEDSKKFKAVVISQNITMNVNVNAESLVS